MYLASCNSSVQNLKISSFLSKNIKIKIYAIVILTAVLYECKTWSLRLWEGHGKSVFENRVLTVGDTRAQEGRGNRGLEKTAH